MKKIFTTVLLACALMNAHAQQKLTLQQCLDNAVKYNHTLQQAQTEIDIAVEQKKEAWTLHFPQVAANALAFKTFKRLFYEDKSGAQRVLTDDPETLQTITDVCSMIGGFEPNLDLLAPIDMTYRNWFHGFDAGYAGTLSAVWPLYVGGQITNGNKLAKIGIQAAELKKIISEREVLQQVTDCYWKLATIKYNLHTIEAAEKQIAAVKERVQALLDAGVITRNALLQVNLRDQELQSTRVKLENGDKLLRLLLANQIGITDRDIDIVVPSEEDIPVLPVYDADGSLNRTELRLAQKGIEAEQIKVKLERGKLMPSVALGVAMFRAATNLSSINSSLDVEIKGPLAEFAPDQTKFHKDFSYQPTKSQNVGVSFASVTIPISQWWGGTHAVRRQKLRVQQARITYDDAKEKVALDNQSAYLKVTEAYKQIEIAQESVKQADENLRIHSEQYDVGTITISDLLDAETLNRKAQNQLSSAIADYQVKLADYLRKISM